MSFSTLRLAVTGLTGQVVSALIERAPRDVEIIALGRPQLELSRRNAVIGALRHAGCDAIINAAAYTQVDKAEIEVETAMRINGEGAGNVAQAASELKVPLVHLSTDYVFDGSLSRPYLENDPPSPTSAYGCSKLEGERQISLLCDNYAIFRTSWVFSPFGANFVKTMLRLGRDRDELSVVADQIGNPTSALDIAEKLILVSRRLASDSSQELRGIFHMTGRGEASWADLAEEIFRHSESHNGPRVKIKRILTQDYPTPAKRPKNSRLDNTKFENVYKLSMLPWRDTLEDCVLRLLRNKEQEG